jgi:MFS transporter, DHA1 family, inner membrane transport protein
MATALAAAPSPNRVTNVVRGRPVQVWVSLVALALGGFAIGTTEFASMGVLPDIAGDLRVSIPTAGQAITAYAIGVVIGAPVFVVLGARLPRKHLLLALMAAIAVANLASAAAGSFPMLVAARFASGLPHGAFFGIGAVTAASLVPAERRARAVAMTMMGLTLANVVGVPLTTLLGQHLGWRSTYATVVVIALLTLVAIGWLVPPVGAAHGASPSRELSALRRPQVWLTVLFGSIGFGGLFAVYSYVTPTLTDVTGLKEATVPLVLAVFGVGMTAGNLIGGRLADWSVLRTLVLGSAASIAVLISFTFTAHAVVPAVVTLFLVPLVSGATIPALTTRLLDVSHEGKSLAASLNHSALNVGNALGAWLGGLVIAAGYGYTSPALVGSGLAAVGLVVLAVSIGLDRRERSGSASAARSAPIQRVPTGRTETVRDSSAA